MDWQARFYPTDVFTGLVQRVETLIADGRFRAPALVREEIEAVGTAGLIQWVQDQTDVFLFRQQKFWPMLKRSRISFPVCVIQRPSTKRLTHM